MVKKGSPYTKPNPWKKWPIWLPCFCGSGIKAKDCPCTHLMPKMIAPIDFVRAEKELKELLAYVQTLFRQNKIFVDKNRAETFQRIFLERDGAYADETKTKKLCESSHYQLVDDRAKKDFEDRSIDLDVINDSLK